MRLFIAINFEDAFADELVSLQDSLQSAGAIGNFRILFISLSVVVIIPPA